MFVKDPSSKFSYLLYKNFDTTNEIILSPKNSSLSFEESFSFVSFRYDLCIKACSKSFLFLNFGRSIINFTQLYFPMLRLQKKDLIVRRILLLILLLHQL